MELPEDFCDLYKDVLNLERLKVQLTMLPDLLRTLNKQQALGIKTVTSVSTIVGLMNANTFSHTFLSEIDQVL